MTSRRKCRGFALLEALTALGLATSLALLTATFLGAAARASLVQPRAVDAQQRLRTALDQLSTWLSAAGQGLGGVGANQGWFTVPALYPQRRGVPSSDADTAAFSDRITLLTGADPPARASLSVAMATSRDVVRINPAACAPGRSACGFAADSHALITDASSAGEWFSVVRSTAGLIEHSPAALSRAYSPESEALLVATEIRSVWFDADTRQLRAASPGADVPWLDGVAGFSIEWFGEPRAPRAPYPLAGQSNCVQDASGSPRLASLEPSGGSWVSLPLATLSDGPWCGAAPWRFDADLFRARLVRVTIRLENPPAAVAGAGGDSAIVQFDVAPRNLTRQR